jgi:uncharacterized protein (TIGR00255 family)
MKIMTNSMTAFARAESAGISWEVRSVNQRYLDVNLKIPDAYRFLEPRLRETLRNKLNRGKVDCLLRVETADLEDSKLELNTEFVTSLKAANEQIKQSIPDAREPTTLEYLDWPGVLSQTQVDREALGERVFEIFKSALDQHIEMRSREGVELERMIEDRLVTLSDIVVQVRSEVEKIQSRQQAKIRSRIEELGVEVDAGRLEQELVYQAQKSDVAEELDRLETHVAEVRSALASKKPIGRRLDFLMQELNREANTLSSKAIAADTTIAAVELKVIIEQMREQVQNIE